MLPLAFLLLAITIGHDVDHIANEERLTDLTWFFWAVILPVQYASYGAFLWLIGRDDERSPLVATVLGFGALGLYTAVHLLPFGPAPFADYDALAISWTLVALGCVTGFALGLAGVRALRRPVALR
jgi:hypothetical protein